MYLCNACSSKDCQRPWKIKFCFQCGGKNIACTVCRGSGTVEANECPRILATAEEIFLLPYFYTYINSDGTVWPDGKAELYQPIKLKEALRIMRTQYDLTIKERTK